MLRKIPQYIEAKWQRLLARIEDAATRYFTARADGPPFTPYTGKLKPLLALNITTPGSRVIDIGAGTGRCTIPLVRNGRRVTAVEIDQSAIDKIKDAIPYTDALNLHCGMAESLPFADHSFDHAICISTLPVVADIDGAMRGIHRVLKPEGTALLSFQNAASLNYRFWADYHARHGVKLWGHSYDEARQLLARHGFKRIKTYALGLTRAHYYMPSLKEKRWIEPLVYSGTAPDWDYRLSNMPGLKTLAAEWFFVVRRL